MLTESEAREILRLDGSAIDLEAVERAFQRMAHRYPPDIFPQKFARIREAHAFFTNADDIWKRFFEDDDVVFSGATAKSVEDVSIRNLDANASFDRHLYLGLARMMLPEMFKEDEADDNMSPF